MMFDFTNLNPDMLAQLAKEVDPTPFLKATEPGGAMDMSGSAASPMGMDPATGMGPGSIFAGAQQGAPTSPLPPGFAGMLNPQQPQKDMRPAPPMPVQGKMPNMPPPVATPQINRVPTLAELLKQRGSM